MVNQLGFASGPDRHCLASSRFAALVNATYLIMTPAVVPDLDIDTNRVRLNRYRHVLHETMRVFAGWLPRIARFELKCEAGRTIWENSLHVNALYLRLREIQSPAFQAPADPALLRLTAELIHAPDEQGLARAYYGVVAPSLIAALENHETATFPNSDLPSVRALRHILLDLRAEQERVRPLLAEAEEAGRVTARAHTWENHITRLLAAAGGIAGEEKRGDDPAACPAGLEFTPPREAARDERFTTLGADLAAMPAEDEHAAHTEEEFERYSTEVLAAETVAVVIYHVRGMPWEFQLDAARHLYDEIRHALMGYEWMRRRGKDPFRSPQYTHILKWRCQFPPAVQYCPLTMGNEVHAFPYRHRRVEAHQRAGDRLSEQFVRYDIADETQHVRFGHRWLPELLKQSGDPRGVEEFTADCLRVWDQEYRTGRLTLNVE